MPVKPRMPATIDTTKKISAHFSSVTVRLPFSRRNSGSRNAIADVTSGTLNWFHAPERHDSPILTPGARVGWPDGLGLAESGSRRQHRPLRYCWGADDDDF